MRHQVDRVGRAAGEDHFAVLARVDEALDLAARFLVFEGRRLRQVVDAAIDIGVLRRLVADEAVDHLARHLARRRIVEIDERLAVDLELEDREVGADALDVVRRRRRGSHARSGGRSWLARRLVEQGCLEPLPERGDRYAIDDLGAERVGEQVARRRVGEPAARR